MCHLTASVDPSLGAVDTSQLVVRVVTTLDVEASRETAVHVRGIREVLAHVDAWMEQLADPRLSGGS